MKKIIFFLVGGAIRDKILNIEINERDWLIAELNTKKINKQNFKAIGKSFVIFLNPINKEENAMPRKKNNSLDKYTESKFVFALNLKEDLICRDLTINSLFLTEKGKIIDPFNNKNYICKKKLKAVSYFFINDKIRIFRVIRFFIKYYLNGFLISSCTYVIILEIVFKSKKEDFKIERILKEIQKVSKYNKLHFIFFEKLYKLNMLNIFFEDLNKLYLLSDIFKFNDYICYSKHINKILYFLFEKTNNNMINFSVLFIKLGYIKKYDKNYSINYNRIKKNVIEKYKQNFILSKKYCNFLNSIFNFYLFYKIRKFEKNKFFNFFVKNILLQKNKIKMINIILILTINEEKNSIINNFYLKYFFLDILDKTNKFNKSFKKTNKLNIFLKNKKIYNIYNFYNNSK